MIKKTLNVETTMTALKFKTTIIQRPFFFFIKMLVEKSFQNALSLSLSLLQINLDGKVVAFRCGSGKAVLVVSALHTTKRTFLQIQLSQ